MLAKLHQCPIGRQRHPRGTRPAPRPTQDEDLTLATIRMPATKNIWAPHDHSGGRDSPNVEWLETLEVLTPPPARPAFRRAHWQLPAGDSPTNQAPDHEPHYTVPHGSLPLIDELRSTLDPTEMYFHINRAVTVALTSHLFFAFGWLVGDGKWAMKLA